MIGAVVALATTALVLVLVLLYVMRQQAVERELWRVERGELINRAIARHTGEVIALDRGGAPRNQHVTEGPLDRPVAVGL